MELTKNIKNEIKHDLRESLKQEKEIDKIVIFGSFLTTNEVNDIDVAIFQNSDQSYLTLALKYRKLTRSISKRVPLDILPIMSNKRNSVFLQAIETGELIYEK
ncbi:nucleotidyltransferase domain-containing protein [bacterium]|nr:nucleotidyltransferase domain-containing protein [bacterium]MBU1065710.1 nucleotidyltransferase domain-containing protein [bacterium]MBU1635022.1 nucleotidyltransferase domain-containing protein [bacterium]MBU1874002.1 nucleotidyltransferase domain-containing protein [bacterium]